MSDARQQEYCRRLVAEHVYECQSNLVDEALKAEYQVGRDGFYFSWEDVENLRQPKDDSDLRYEYRYDADYYDRAVKFLELSDNDDSFEAYLLYVCNISNPAADLDGRELEEVYPIEWDEYNEIKDSAAWLLENDDVEFVRYLEDFVNASEDDLFEDAEVYEWWLCSDWLIRRLREHNEPILENDYGTWWGRTTSGQAILLDWVIVQIERKHHAQFADPGEAVYEYPPLVSEVLEGWRKEMPTIWMVDAENYRDSYKWAWKVSHKDGSDLWPEAYFEGKGLKRDDPAVLAWGVRNTKTNEFHEAFTLAS